MNREIKFRAWDEKNKIMHNDFQFIKSGNEGKDWVVFLSDKQPDFETAMKNPYFSQQLKIMQYTGIKDKKRTPEFPEGQEVYEGDKVKTPYQSTARLVWSNTFACFCLETIDDIVKDDIMYNLRDIEEVIGIDYEFIEAKETKNEKS